MLVMDPGLYAYIARRTSEPDPYGCQEWAGIRKDGYGVVRIDGRWLRVHRLVWALANPNEHPLTAGEYICHRCDNRSCINPRHLYRGDAKFNARDRDFRRMLKGLPWGEYLGIKPY